MLTILPIYIININMSTLIVKDIPVEVKNKFKALCAGKGKTLKEELIRLMREAIENDR